MSKKVCYKDLTWPLQTAVVIAWIVGVIYVLAIIGGILSV